MKKQLVMEKDNLTYHAAVEVLLHFTEGVWRYLALAGDNDANIRHCQRVLRLDWWRSAECDKDALRGGGAVVDVGAAAIRCGLDDLAALDQALLTLIQHPVTGGGKTCQAWIMPETLAMA